MSDTAGATALPDPAAPLTLAADGAVQLPSLSDHFTRSDADPLLVALVLRIADAALPLAARLARGAVPGDPEAITGHNDSGDRQKALDAAAHEHMLAALSGASVAQVLSEEAPVPITLDPEGAYDVAIDPIDGSGSIGIGAQLGLLFCVYPAGHTILRRGRDAVAAGYVCFGHSVDLGVTLGDGVAIATHDPTDGTYRITTERARIAPEAAMIAFNASNHRHWAPGLRAYVDDCLAGADGPRGRDVNMRWIAAAVGDLHRILQRGGAFLYPADARPKYAHGHLRLAYEAAPIALLMEQAGGAATDGTRPILDLVPETPHQKTPLFFGAADEIALISRYLSD